MVQLPTFPWDLLGPYRAEAATHPDGVVDLSIGTPVDPTPAVIQDALRAATDSPGYPQVVGTPALRQAIVAWAQRARAITVTEAGVMPTIGSKEFVAHAAFQLGIGAADRVGFPACAYPTYDIGARLAGAEPVPLGPDPSQWPDDLALVWLNTPGNPDGHVLDEAQLRAIIAWARARGTIVIADECYAPLDWRAPAAAPASGPVSHTPSLLSDSVTDGDQRGLLVAYSLSKQSNLAGYRAAFVMGDPELIARLVEIRRHSGAMVPAPVQAAMIAALNDDDHVRAQRDRYQARRDQLLAAIEAAGLEHDPQSKAGLYLWVGYPGGHTPGHSDTDKALCWDLVGRFAALGIVVAPGEFYGAAAADRVRIALTASDADIAAAVARLGTTTTFRA